MGLWVENGALDRFDKKISSLIFTLELPWLLETALTLPGSWFGATTFSLGWVGMLTAFITQYHHHPEEGDGFEGQVFLGIFVVITLAALALHFLVLSKKAERKYLWHHLHYYLLINLFLPYFLFGKNSLGWRGFVFYMCIWGCTQLVSQTMKFLFARIRPCACPEYNIPLSLGKRTHDLSTHLSSGMSSVESFPSGDAAGAAAFSSSMVIITGSWWWVLFALFGAFGRVYFHAHHVVDVVVGSGLAVGMAVVLSVVGGGWEEFGVVHFFGVIALFVVLWRLIDKIKPEPSEFNKGDVPDYEG